MDDRKRITWLNTACVGPSSSKGGTLDTARAAEALRLDLAVCVEWVSGWLRCDREEVVLTSGTTEACDLALLLSANHPEVFVHTDLAHETAVESVKSAAALHASISGRATHVQALPVADLLSLDPQAFVLEACKRLDALCDGRPAVLVLEHVTSAEGARLPVELIAERIAAGPSSVELIIDGAQAVGIWKPERKLAASYIGCFHKYADGPIGTGFARIQQLSVDRLPHHAKAMRLAATKAGRGEILPTCDVGRWAACASRLEELRRGATTTDPAPVLLLRELLVQSLEEAGLLPVVPRSDYASHIVAIALEPGLASRVWLKLRDAGFATKLGGHTIRVTLHHTVSEQDVTCFAEELRRALVHRE